MLAENAEQICLRYLKRQQDRFIEAGFEIIKTTDTPDRI